MRCRIGRCSNRDGPRRPLERHAVLGNLAVLEDQFAGDTGIEECFLSFRGPESLVVFLDDEPRPRQVGPHHGNVGDGAVGDPHLRPLRR